MGLIDNKKNVFTTIGAYTSLMQSGTLPQGTNIFPSINNKKDVVPYLLDILKVVVGSNALQELTGQLFTKFIDTVEPQSKTAVKKQLIQYNSGSGLPTTFQNGISVPVKDIDINGTLKTNPASQEGSLLYNNSTPNFNSSAYQAIKNAGTDIQYNNLIINYNSATDSFKFKPTTASASQNIGKWFSDFVDNTELINKKTFMTNVMNGFYGSVTAKQNKTVQQVYSELQVNKLLEQLVNDDDSFIISPEDYEALQVKANEMVNGVVYYDLGCGLMEAVFPLSGMTDLITNISGSTDPFYVGNQINATIDSSTKNTPATSNANKQTVKDGFFQRIIHLILMTLVNAVTSTPQVRTLLALSSAFQNNGTPQIGSPLDDMKKFRIFLNCVIKEATKMINKFIFDLIVTFLISLLNPVIRKILKEKINQYVGILKSLTASNTT